MFVQAVVCPENVLLLMANGKNKYCFVIFYQVFGMHSLSGPPLIMDNWVIKVI